jgi:DivIVA domain-containing protein
VSEEFFRLTPLDVRTQEFMRAVRGYDRAQVDHFKLQVAEELEKLVRDRMQAERAAQERAGTAARISGARAGDERSAGSRAAAPGRQPGAGGDGRRSWS